MTENLVTKTRNGGEPVDLLDQPGRRTFSGWALIVGWLAMLIFTFHACTHMVAAGDTWVAMACGRHFLHHDVDTVEPFSANSHKAGPTLDEIKTWPTWAKLMVDANAADIGLDAEKAKQEVSWLARALLPKLDLATIKYWHPTGWVNQNWLTHEMFYWLTTTLGSEEDPYFNALVFWKFAVYFLAVVCLYFTARTLGVYPALAAIFACFAMFIGRSFIDVRPAGFSNLLVAAFLLALALASYRNALYVWLIVPIIVFWSNVHGGYVYAFIVLVPFVVWHLLMQLPKRWTIAVYGMLTWVVLYGMANRVLHHEHLAAVPVLQDWAFYLLAITIGIGIALGRHPAVGEGHLVAFTVTASCVLFLLYLTRFFPALPNLASRERSALTSYLTGSGFAYAGIFALAMILGWVVASLKDRLIQTMTLKGIGHVVGAAATALVAMLIFNPFHLTNLTHTFIISVSKHAERWRDVHEWHRAFDWSNPVGTARPFLLMYIVGWLVLLVWAVILVRSAKATTPPGRRRTPVPAEDNWPKMDMALLLIAALTVYMAIRSRRFIPIAGFAACPIIALLIDQAIRVVAATDQWKKIKKFEVPSMSPSLQQSFLIAGAGVVLFFGTWWGFKFKRIYLDYWPADPKFTSVFMRMTASDAKPFYACQFIRENKLSGKMFNYWTEGGFIAYGQTPDPKTGRTPLQLFMDGRAQAAYDRKTFDLWTEIISGGEPVRRAVASNRRLTRKDYIEIGAWISEQLDKYDVWVVMMPSNQFDRPMVNGLEHSLHWRTVFTNNKQKIFVNINTPQGQKLFDGMFTGQTVYPDEYSAALAIGHNLLLFRDPQKRQQGLDLIAKAFALNPSPAPMLSLLIAAQFPELTPQIEKICQDYATAFEENKGDYVGHDGFNFRLEAARLALVQVAQSARARGNTALLTRCTDQMQRYLDERNRISNRKRW